MLGIKHYPQDHVDACRTALDAQVAAYHDLVAVVDRPKGDDAVDAFAPGYFNNLVIVLDAWFTHRLRTVEGKDGNPLNEVRALCTSLWHHGGTFTVDKGVKLRPETSVLGLHPGDPVALTEADFTRLAAAFLTEIEARFGG